MGVKAIDEKVTQKRQSVPIFKKVTTAANIAWEHYKPQLVVCKEWAQFMRKAFVWNAHFKVKLSYHDKAYLSIFCMVIRKCVIIFHLKSNNPVMPQDSTD